MRHPAAAVLVLFFSTAGFALHGAETPSLPDWSDVLLPRVELPATANGLVRWRPELAKLMPEDPVVSSLLQENSSPLSFVADPSLLAWLKTVEPALSTLVPAEGEQLQFPPIHGPETPFPDHQPLRQLALVRLAAAKAAWISGRRQDALDAASANLSLARAMLASQEGLIPLLQGSALWQIALDGIYWLARQPELTARQAADLQAELDRDDRLAPNALARAFRGEFTFFTVLVIERLPRTRDLDVLLSSIGSLGMAPPAEPEEGTPRLAPPTQDPFDRTATLQASAADIRGYLTTFAVGTRYPRGFSDNHTYPRLREYAGQLGAFLRYATEDIPVTPELIASANAAVAGTENPVGKLFLVIATSQWDPIIVSLFRREAERSALTGLLAWRRQGRPASWDDLIVAHVLKAAPADPFGSGALRYDLTTPRIWSVGPDGIDDGGSGDGENLGRPADLTWPALP